MATRTFLSLESKLAPSVPGCPAPTLQQYIRDAAIEVCERTLAWRHDLDPVSLSAGTFEYAYSTPADTEVCGLIHAALNGQALPFVTQEDIHRMYPDWPSTDTTRRAEPRFISQFDPDNYVVAPVPDATYSLKLFLALRPTPDSTGMDQTAFDELEQLIMHGALQHLLVLPDKSWTDRELATYHAKQYTYKIAARRAKANLGVGRATLSVRTRPFA